MKSFQIIAILFLAPLAMPVFGATCSLTATGVSFGTYIPNQAMPADSAGSMTIACVKGLLDTLPTTVSYSVDISRGRSSSYSPREMTSGANTLRYNLYRDASRLTIWGDTTGGTSNVTGALQLPAPLGSASVMHNVYSRIFAGQNAVPGIYADSIVVTVMY